MNDTPGIEQPALTAARIRHAQYLLGCGKQHRALAHLEKLSRDETSPIVVQLRASEIAQGLGSYRKAHAFALEAAERTSKRKLWAALPYVAMRLLAFGERRRVATLVLSAELDHPDVIRHAPSLSQALWLVGQFGKALELAEEAERKAGASHLLSYSRANALRYSGRLAEATDAFEQTIRINPDYAYAHWSLAYHEKTMVSGARVDRIKRAISAHGGGSEEAACLHYALFKEFDDAGDVEQAWVALKAGMDIKRRRSPTTGLKNSGSWTGCSRRMMSLRSNSWSRMLHRFSSLGCRGPAPH